MFWVGSIGVAVALKQALTPEFKAYQRQVLANCKALASTLMNKGYKIVTGEHNICFKNPYLQLLQSTF